MYFCIRLKAKVPPARSSKLLLEVSEAGELLLVHCAGSQAKVFYLILPVWFELLEFYVCSRWQLLSLYSIVFSSRYIFAVRQAVQQLVET